ncbi:hypothetical protein Ppa06_67340 [Planomonospora parontospora subsp. parontospora]|uniref:Uncharacterized protein n=2 Tax=Planomonospora parontospora TaxID=58119 RepID=A0AA37BNV9_9ACTN|nr:hypothetical protein [Planomonospora parontospora]GGK99421.1 hypothetical protein GCM10010126_68790 [Planomonospora parontospora]GII12936.1 hypothetical protein Ppa06_67340 [Planomonospora parontospora subsp. parontospora]
MTVEGPAVELRDVLTAVTMLASDMGELKAAIAASKPALEQTQLNKDLLAALVGQVNELAETLEGIKRRDSSEPKPRPWCWTTMTYAERAERLAELADWVTEVLYLRPEVPLAVPICWSFHPDIVDDLSALYCGWQTAYLWSGGRATDALDYLTRALPAVLRRISSQHKACASNHQPPSRVRDDSRAVAARVQQFQQLAAQE